MQDIGYTLTKYGLAFHQTRKQEMLRNHFLFFCIKPVPKWPYSNMQLLICWITYRKPLTVTS